LSQPENGIATLASIRSEVLKKFGADIPKISYATIRNLIKKTLFSKKRTSKYPIKRNAQQTIIQRKEFAIQYLNLLKLGKRIVSIDETGFNSQMMPLYLYSKKGKKALCQSLQKA